MYRWKMRSESLKDWIHPIVKRILKQRRWQ
nr:MAG TPA: hypothetical protein [Bacteriophage sp.]